MSLSGCQIDPTNVNFHIKKSLEIFDKNSADKIWSKKDKEINVSPLMPIRVNKLKVLFCFKTVPSDLKKFVNFRYSASNFSSSQEHIFLSIGWNNFRNKILFLYHKVFVQNCHFRFLGFSMIPSFLERHLGLFRSFFWAHENHLHWKMGTEKWKWHTRLQCLLHFKSFRYALPPSRDCIWLLLELYILLLSFCTRNFFVCNFKQSNRIYLKYAIQCNTNVIKQWKVRIFF